MCDRGEATGKVCKTVLSSLQLIVGSKLTDASRETPLPERLSPMVPTAADAVATSQAGVAGESIVDSVAASSRQWLTQPSSPEATRPS